MWFYYIRKSESVVMISESMDIYYSCNCYLSSKSVFLFVKRKKQSRSTWSNVGQHQYRWRWNYTYKWQPIFLQTHRSLDTSSQQSVTQELDCNGNKGYSTMHWTPFFLKMTMRSTLPYGWAIVWITSCRRQRLRRSIKKSTYSQEITILAHWTVGTATIC